ncbi:MAG TPA: response regulator transcription factor [Chitinophagaceae bacterium]|nr:response regulator transcription factor [Chitinophagaceae bacterium]
MKYTIRLIIADDHEIFRDGLALMLSRQKDIILLGQASNGKELAELTEQHNPDVIITDIKMPVMDGIQASKLILKKQPDVKIIALSMFDEETLIVDMLEAGAKGYLLKNADKQEILEAIETVYEDKTYYCHHTSATLTNMIVKSNFNPYKKKEPVSFNEREIEIIKLICQQNSSKEISDKLYLSSRTVEGYRTKILEKMNARNTVGVVVYALKHNLIERSEVM